MGHSNNLVTWQWNRKNTQIPLWKNDSFCNTEYYYTANTRKTYTPHTWISFSKYFKYGESSKPSRTTCVNYQNRRTTPALLCQFLTLFLRKTELFKLYQQFQTLSLCNIHTTAISEIQLTYS